MKRRVLIITNPGKEGNDNYCSGVYKDKENYFSYFKEPFGGLWSDSELRYQDKPSKSWVENEVGLLLKDDIEFSVIIFCGHGWYSSQSNSNILELNDKEQIDSLSLRLDANKRIIILDSCRKVSPSYINESLMKSFSMKALFEETSQKLNPQLCKKYYNKTISNCPKQIINAYACNLNEVAGDDPSFGGFYSSSLIKASKQLVDNKLKSIDINNKYCAFRFTECHDESLPNVKKLSGGTQNPQIVKPRLSESSDYLPFAIVA